MMRIRAAFQFAHVLLGGRRQSAAMPRISSGLGLRKLSHQPPISPTCISTRIRSGFTLIESLVVIALTGVTLTIVTVTMHTLHRAEHRVHDDLQGQRTLDQIGAQLRWDAHEALSAATVGGADGSPPRGVILALADGRSIQYSLVANRLERVLRRAESVEHREDYRLAFADGYWSVDAKRGRPLLTLHLVPLDPRQVPPVAVANERTIQAAVGIVDARARKGGRDESQP